MRQFWIGMTDAERAAHKPGTGITLVDGKMELSTRTLADTMPPPRPPRAPPPAPPQKLPYAGKDPTEGKPR